MNTNSFEGSTGKVAGSGTLRSMNFLFLVLFLTFILVDPIRRLQTVESGATLNYLGLIATDIVCVLMVALFALGRLPAPASGSAHWFVELPYPFKMLAGFWVTWAVLELFNPYFPNLLLSLAGAREYLLPTIGLLFGWYAMHYWGPKQWQWLFRILLFSVVGLIIFSIVQYIVDSEAFSGAVQSLLTPAEHAVHTWEDEDSMKLVSSVFASSKRYGRFLLMIFPLLWIYLKRHGRRNLRIATVLLFMVGCFVSGSREAVIMLGLMELLLEGWSALLPKILVLGTAALLLVPSFVGSDLADRVKFAFSTSEDWSDRIDYMVLGPLFRDLEGSDVGAYAFGFGAGRYGQATQVLGEGASVIDLQKGAGAGSVDDAGLYKILLDSGVVGLIIFLTFNIYVLFLCWPLRRRLRDIPLYRASGVAILTWQILFLKSHTTLSDVMIHLFFWFYLGMLLATRAASRALITPYSVPAISSATPAAVTVTS